MQSDKKPKKIAFVVQLPKHVSPGQRFRFEQYEKLLSDNNFEVVTCSFLDEKTYRILYKNGFLFKKIWGVVKGFISRVGFLLTAHKYDFIFLQREVAPIGPPIFEWFLAKILKKKIVYDFDDAIWIANTSASNRLARYVKCFWKIRYISKWSYKISAGNEYLANWASQYNRNVTITPTCVDIVGRYNEIKDQNSKPITIGWTGSHSTLKYLDLVADILKELEEKYPIVFTVICDKPASLPLQSMHFIKWQEESEIDDLLTFNIGIMPLQNDEWSEGKCGFKLIQYLSLGIPAAASPVGINKQIIDNGKNGYLCSSKDEWKAALQKLIEDEMLRTSMGKEGRQKIEDNYSVQSNSKNFLSLFS
ncbi:glycosyltransferase family 4 protein [Taibaiella soli]|uniref:Glycosyltransferase family 1 protein n=1 Tax=Taibaiella soli TaxID=1649169 RepID=A0A2W2AIH1_9BACT|nr:glycosyltransferase family 4 protein [Taibaiella soli]PZF72030.1 glycosyltransferase family 1 protein [Taibaiella soli]